MKIFKAEDPRKKSWFYWKIWKEILLGDKASYWASRINIDYKYENKFTYKDKVYNINPQPKSRLSQTAIIL